MMSNKYIGAGFAFIAILSAVAFTFAQTPPLQKRTITKIDRFDFGVGGTVAITGAPTGSVRVAGWQKHEIEITAVIELQAPTDSDLGKLAEISGFVTDESPGRTGIVSIGTHNKFGLKKMPRNFPKNLLGLPFRIDYVINVPHFCDLEIDGGKGDLSIAGVEGAMRVNFIESKAKIEVISGATVATFGSGSVEVGIGTRGWRARVATIQIATGDLTIRLPANLNAEIDAVILRTGKIENNLPGMNPRDRQVVFTDKSIAAKTGVGGVPLKFTVGDGMLKIGNLVLPF